MIPNNPGIAQKGTQKSGNSPKNPGAHQKSTQNNGTSPFHDIYKLPSPPESEVMWDWSVENIMSGLTKIYLTAILVDSITAFR